MQTQPIDNSVWTMTLGSKKFTFPSSLTSNPKQTLCFAINELEDLVKSTPTDNNVRALGLLNQALSLL